MSISEYKRLKAKILACLGVTTAVREQRPDRPPRSQMHELVQLVKKMAATRKVDQSLNGGTVVMDLYLQSLPDDLQHWVSHGDPTTMDQLVELVERNTMVVDLLGPAKRWEPTPRAARPAAVPRRDGPCLKNGGHTVLAMPVLGTYPGTVPTSGRAYGMQGWSEILFL